MWKVVGASVAGKSHESAGRGCEDASAWRAGAGLTCLAVADGAGSRPLSGQGAALAVKTALSLVGEQAGDQDVAAPAAWLRRIFAGALEEITALASADSKSVGDYATTLAVAIVTGDIVAIGQIGDTIAVVGYEGRFEAVQPPPRPEYVNETTFITAPGALEEIRITVRPAAEVDAIFLATDGLRFKILDDLAAGAPFTPFFEDMAAYIRTADASEDAICTFLTRLDDQSGDDKTIVAAALTFD